MRWYGIMMQLKLPRIMQIHAQVDTTAQEDHTERIFGGQRVLKDQNSLLKHQFKPGLMNIKF